MEPCRVSNSRNETNVCRAEALRQAYVCAGLLSELSGYIMGW